MPMIGPIIGLLQISTPSARSSKDWPRNDCLNISQESPNWGTFQSAYRPLHSTETAMTRVVNDLLTNVDCEKLSVLLSLDISAAFDTLDHDMLLQRSGELFGLSGRVNEWLRTLLVRPNRLRVTGWFSLCRC